MKSKVRVHVPKKFVVRDTRSARQKRLAAYLSSTQTHFASAVVNSAAIVPCGPLVGPVVRP